MKRRPLKAASWHRDAGAARRPGERTGLGRGASLKCHSLAAERLRVRVGVRAGLFSLATPPKITINGLFAIVRTIGWRLAISI